MTERIDNYNWIPTSKAVPPDGEPVWAMDSGGNVQTLIRKGRLWWFSDLSMYVYYTPQFWKAKGKECLNLNEKR